MWSLGSILNLDHWKVGSWKTGWNLRAGIQSRLSAGRALANNWWLVLVRAVAEAYGWDRSWVDATAWVHNAGGGADGAGGCGGGGHEASLSGRGKIWLGADVTWVTWLGGVPNWALVSSGGSDIGSLVSIAVDNNNNDDDNFDTDDDWASSDRWSGVRWSNEDSAGAGWGGGGDHSGCKD